MKIKTILAVGAFSLGLTGLAHAVTTNYCYITGSTAFRPTTYDAIVSLFTPAPDIAAGKCSTIGSLDAHTAGQMKFTGNIITGVNTNFYIIKCAWSGSEGGIGNLTAAAGAGKVNFVDDSVVAQVTTNTLSQTDNHTVDLAFADNEQAYSLTKTPALTGAQAGVVPFIWVKNGQTNSANPTAPADWTRLNNITASQARVVLAGGSPLALLTGNAADTNWVYVAGRDNQSGTRVNALLNSQFGLVNPPAQVTLALSNGVCSLQGGLTASGESSGGTLAGKLTYPGSATNGDSIYLNAYSGITGVTNGGFYAIAYVGLYDADIALGIQSAIALPNCVAGALTWNGVAETPDNIRNGTYSFWGNLMLYKSKNNLSSQGSAIYTKLLAAIPANVDHNHAFSTTEMLATKNNAASDATHN